MSEPSFSVDASVLIGEGGVKLLIALRMGATTIEEVARLSGLNERVARAKFNTLQELGLVKEKEGRITLSSKGKTILEEVILECLRT
ncbi:MAG: hypothetical protein QXW47_06135 [Candidatus Jordarchaeales archaeon]